MNTKAEAPASGMDVFKLWISALLVLASLAAFYLLADQQPLLFRVLGIVAAVVIASVISLTTEKGRNFAGFMRDARTEVRKMVWPTRAETIQTTLVVFVVVFILAIILWGFDRILAYLMKFVIQ